MTLNRVWRCIRPIVPAFVVCAVLVTVAKSPWGCGRPTKPYLHQPITYAGVPTVRVLITPRPVEEIILSAPGTCRLGVGEDTLIDTAGPLGRTVVTRQGETWHIGAITAPGPRAFCQPAAQGYTTVGQVNYRGRIELVAVGEASFIVVNHLDMESYLAGVLSKELYPSWLGQTYRALAVAARTFAMYHMTASGPGRDYDLGSTQASQVYGGMSGETEKSWQAVRTTHGQVLTFGPDGGEEIFMAQYSSSCGGRVNPASVIRNARDIPPLAGGQECNTCSSSSRYRWQPVKISKADLHKALAACYQAASELAAIDKLQVAGRTAHGRAIWLDVIGTQGKSIRIRADDLRLALLRTRPKAAQGLYSMNCQLRDAGDSVEFFDGRGFGHGVGLCQWGAEGMAAGGAASEEILAFYYPGAKIHQAY